MAAPAVAVVARLAVAIAYASRGPETFESETLVDNLLHGRGYVYPYLGATYRSFHGTLPYDALTAATYAVAREHRSAMLVVQALLGAALCVVVGRLGARLGGRSCALLAAWSVALQPALVVYDGTKLQQIGLDALLFASLLLACARWVERPSSRRAAIAGLLAALLLYERATMVLAIAWMVAWVAVHAPGPMRARQLVVCAATAVALLAPWTARNAIVQRRFVPFATTSWVNLWKGNHEGATGSELDAQGRPFLEVMPSSLRAQIEGAGELAQMDAFRSATLRFVHDEPLAAARLLARKQLYFWWRSPDTGRSYASGWARVYAPLHALVVGLFLAGVVALWRAPDRRALGLLIVGAIVAFGLVQGLGFVAGRHRLTVVACEPVIAALGAVSLLDRWRRR